LQPSRWANATDSSPWAGTWPRTGRSGPPDGPIWGISASDESEAHYRDSESVPLALRVGKRAVLRQLGPAPSKTIESKIALSSVEASGGDVGCLD